MEVSFIAKKNNLKCFDQTECVLDSNVNKSTAFSIILRVSLIILSLIHTQLMVLHGGLTRIRPVPRFGDQA